MSAAAVLKLQAAGFSADQVAALAELIDSQASSKSDLLEVEHRLETRITDVEHRLEARIVGIEARIAKSKIDMIKWMIGLLLAQTGLLPGGLKLFTH